MYTENVIRDLQGSAEALKEVESEWVQLEEDRRLLRKIFLKVSIHYLFYNLLYLCFWQIKIS